MERPRPRRARFRPRQALEAGPAGTEVIERLIPQAVERLEPGGWLLLEVSPMIEPQVVRMIVSRTELKSLPTRKDSAGLARVVMAKAAVNRGSLSATPFSSGIFCSPAIARSPCKTRASPAIEW